MLQLAGGVFWGPICVRAQSALTFLCLAELLIGGRRKGKGVELGALRQEPAAGGIASHGR